MVHSLVSRVPSVDSILRILSERYPHLQTAPLKRLVQLELDSARKAAEAPQILNHSREEIIEHFVNRSAAQLERLLKGTLRKVINATGVVLHTGLGRAPLDERVSAHLAHVARYASLEFDLESGRRGQRNDHVSLLLQLLTGAEQGLAVNNNAAAVMLMLNTVAYGKEVILSRGEMIEIGGSFRLPEVMKMSGVLLREIGTTNKTHIDDYRRAVNENTGAILICHSSNYQIQGFTHKPAVTEIVRLGKEYNLPVIFDLGSGSFSQTARLAGDREPEVSEIVRQGLDLISFSGDKLLGGPQAGIIVGKKQWVEKCAQNHLLRALRLDKLILTALQRTLIQYLYTPQETERLAAHQALLASAQELRERSERLVSALTEKMRSFVTVEPGSGKVGSGAFPTTKLPGYVLRINHPEQKPEKLARALRLRQTVPVIGYVKDDSLYLDLRTVAPEEEQEVIKALQEVW